VRRLTHNALKDATDEHLLAACIRGEAAAWDALLDRYGGLIYSVPLKYGLADADAADVFQSVCVTLLEKLDTVRAPRGLAAWLITTTSRQCLAIARQRRRDQAHLAAEGSAYALREPLDPELLPEEELLALERQRVVRAAVERLPSNCQRLLDVLFSDTQSKSTYRQLAKDAGVPMNSLGPTRTRCLEKLRRLLEVAGYFPRPVRTPNRAPS
jgi:RNA polymerase sigma factor (sigma-70 family)